jgi:hypothetical protein
VATPYLKRSVAVRPQQDIRTMEALEICRDEVLDLLLGVLLCMHIELRKNSEATDLPQKDFPKPVLIPIRPASSTH